MIQDAEGFKMDLVGGLERVLHGKVKPSTRARPCHIKSLFFFFSLWRF